MNMKRNRKPVRIDQKKLMKFGLELLFARHGLLPVLLTFVLVAIMLPTSFTQCLKTAAVVFLALKFLNYQLARNRKHKRKLAKS